MGSMDGKVVVITGGNAGIGKEAAVGLAMLGATVVITARNAAKGAAALEEIASRTGSSTVEVMALDLADFSSIRSFTNEFLATHDRLDVLLENAGLLLSERSTTRQGFETTFGVNHVGHFLLTDLLLDRLRESAPSRIVVVASHAHKSARQGLDFDDLQTEHQKYAGLKTYSRSKLANVYFARELARRLEGTGVTVNALHPGFVASDFARDGDTGPLMSVGVRIARPFAINTRKGALTSVYLASSREVDSVTGKYFHKCRAVRPSKIAQDDDAARRLWEATEALVANAGE